MAIWVLWAVLITGERVEAGQYFSEERCVAAAKMQRPFWVFHYPKVKRMECEIVIKL